MDYDAVIIGAGMSGLAAGIRLAYFEKKVCICERHYAVGGLNSFYRMKGRKFDVGLHAMTNYVPPGTRGAPLTKLLRQLRIRHEEFGLIEQNKSRVCFPGKTLTFTNEFDFFVQEVIQSFPEQADNFNKLVKCILEHNELDLNAKPASAREVVGSYISDPILVDMIFCPVLFYGSAWENDIEFGQFVVMFKSLFYEGMSRPFDGVRRILDVLKKKYLNLGGELRMKSGIKEITVKDGRAHSLTLDSGDRITADRILSSAGYPETLRLCTGQEEVPSTPREGSLSFVESISILDRFPADLGYDSAITFFNDSDSFDYSRPDEPVDIRSGVICSPNNFQYETSLEEGVMRISSLANYDIWSNLPEDEYKQAKIDWHEKVVDAAVQFVPEFRPYVVFTDTFTPRTIFHYTGHLGGAVYGSPDKVKDGRTSVNNLFICGTDQGFLGIIGAMLSGISMVNLHCLMDSEGTST